MKQDQINKPFSISKRIVYDAWMKVRENKGSAGIDAVSISSFELELSKNLYKLWNRMSSGTYFPQPVKLVEIPKLCGGKRPLGIPTVTDRIAQTAVVLSINERLDREFHKDSYAYRSGFSATEALSTARQRCWRYEWALDMDISRFFDTIDHDLLMKAVRRHVSERWILLYIERWLKVPYETVSGDQIERPEGVSQGSVIGPVLANLFLHYVFDKWMQIHYPHIPFERYADDIICHCRTKAEAEVIHAVLMKRLKECNLKLNEEKTRIVYCKDSRRKASHECISFDFLGYTFRPRYAMNPRSGEYFTGFLPAISRKSKNHIHSTIRSWQLNRKMGYKLKDIANLMAPVVRGWSNYYGKFYPRELKSMLQALNHAIVRWALRKYARLKSSFKCAFQWLIRIFGRNPNLFYHWQFGVKPCYFKIESGQVRRAE